MCTCYPILKSIRESAGSDALWYVDLRMAGQTPRAMHAIGPAASLTSCVALITAQADQLGALIDSNGFITQLFTVPGGFGNAVSPILAAWNGSSRVWFWYNAVFNQTNGTVAAYNLSGTRILATTASQNAPRNRFGMCVNSSGHLVFVTGTALQIRNDSFGLVASASTTNATTYSYGDTVCVDSSDNVFVTTTTYIRKCDSSLGTLWTNSLPMHHLGCVCDSSGAVYVFSNDSGAGKIRKYNSSGTLQWTVTLSSTFDSAAVNGAFDVWCDGSNIYFAGKIGSTYTRLKYDSSGSQLWSEFVWWGRDTLSTIGPITIRGDGTNLALAGLQQT